MPNWASLAELANEGVVLTNLIFVLFGLYVWEILITLDFEWSLISRTRKMSWPLVRYALSDVAVACFAHTGAALFFLCRYSLVGALVGMIVSFQIKSPINCQALYTWNSVSGNLAILAASTSLLLRTVALWNRRKIIAVVLGVLCLAHWAILLRGMFLIDAEYSAEAQGCIVTHTNHIFLNVTFFTTMGVDFIVLCFTIAALLRQELHSGLWKLLFKDGLVYFCITFLCNAVPAILNVLNLNTVMDIIATIPAATVSTIAACRLIMRLHAFSNKDAVLVNTASANAYGGPNQFAMVTRPPPRVPGIRVTTDQFVVEDFSPAECSSKRAEFDADSDMEEYKNSRPSTAA